MRAKGQFKAVTALAVGAAIVFAGCGGGGDPTTSGRPASATTPAGESSSEAAMKHEDAMKKQGDAMKENGSAMHDEGSMRGG